jgi:starch phosphorylase
VGTAFADTEAWTRSSIANCARSAHFSSDRSISEYCRNIWQVERVPVPLLSETTARLEFIQ